MIFNKNKYCLPQVELENTLEQEQEALVNRLWKRMDKLEAEKRSLQIRLDQPVSDPASPRWKSYNLSHLYCVVLNFVYLFF